LRNNAHRRGAVSFQLLVIFVPVLLGFIGFAVDLGRLYMVRSELKAAANAMALSAAQQLIGTAAATANASAVSLQTVETASGYGNKYDFAGLNINDTGSTYISTVVDPTFYAAAADAKGTDGSSADSTTAKYVKLQITGEAPVVFWSFLSLAQDRKVNVIAQAIAGISAPLCTACGIDPIAIAALSTDDTTDFGFVAATRYTFGYSCNGNPVITGLSGAAQVIPYLLLDRYNQAAVLFPDEGSQLFRIGTQGLPPTNPYDSSLVNAAGLPLGCIQVGAAEAVWASASPQACSTTTPQPSALNYVCGLAGRFDPNVPDACVNIAEVASISSINAADTDLTDLDDYTSYVGNSRRIISVPIVDALNPGGGMTVLGYRQFLIEPDPGNITLTPADRYSRFVALYLGSVMPIKGSVPPRPDNTLSCTITSGPGKVVLYQ
jgi:Flp pilus assembly protein TadG